MDYLDWDCSPIVASISSSWSAHQEHHEVAEAFSTSESHHSNCGAYNYNGEKYMDLPEDVIFNPTHKLTDFNITADPIISQSHHLNFYSNPEKVLNRMVQHLAPPLDSIIVSPNPNIFSRAETLLSTFPQGPGLCSLKRPHSVMMENTLSGLIADFGMPLYEESNVFGSVAVSANIESSLNGLIPATNSYTHTSRVEDDGINSILSSDKSCKNLDSESIFPKANNIEKYQTFDGKFSSGFSLIISNDQPPAPSKKRKIEKAPSSTNISFQQPSNKNSLAGGDCVIDQEPDSEAIAQMKEMIYRAAAFRPVTFGDDVVEKPKRKNVKISSDPQTVAARQRRERISEKIRVLQKLVPGGSKMDTASMLDEAANYLKFLRSQVKALENLGPNLDFGNNNAAASNVNQSAISTSVAPFSIQNSSTFSTS